MTTLQIKLAERATMPSKANVTDSGYDIVAHSVSYNEEKGYLQYGTGIFLQVPEPPRCAQGIAWIQMTDDTREGGSQLPGIHYDAVGT